VKKARCAKAKVPGGQWSSYGHDFSNTRSQPRESTIGPDQFADLAPQWTFSTEESGGSGDITGTPVIAAGCVFVGTNDGWAFALNADNGKVVWKKKLPYGGQVNSSAFVKRDRVYFAATRTAHSDACPKRRKDPCIGPYVIAYRKLTGRLAWATRSLDKQRGSDIYGSPVVLGRTLMIGISGGSAELGDETDRYAFQGSVVFLDTRRGRLLRKTWTIHRPNKPKDDFAGAGVWSTPAVDRRAQVAYVGTANPFRPQAEHPRSNAVIKYDLNRGSRRFGKIIGA
jgi:glucose dehydrogenase